MSRSLFAAVLAVALAAAPLLGQELPRANPEDGGMSSERLERITHAFQDYVDGERLPAFASTTVAETREGGGYAVVEAERPITIRHLLTHTSGIGYGGGPGGDRWEDAGTTGWYFAHRDEPIRAGR